MYTFADKFIEIKILSLERILAGVRSFLFQAEDGIRYGTVTGVQTCALPIYGQQCFRAEGVDPGKVHKRVALMLTIPQPDAWVLRCEIVSSNGGVLDIVRVGIVRNLIIVLAQRGNEAELVGRIDVENQRAKASIPVGGIVNHLR